MRCADEEVGVGPVTAATLVAQARARAQNLRPAAVAAELDQDVLLVDVREEDERRAHGAIPGSIRAPRGMLEFWADPTSSYHRAEFSPDRRIILYCATGERSVLATETLRRLGYRKVAHLDGGLEAWGAQGYPVEPAS
jgi:rhodanese-related sulfurtransferase